MISYTKNEKDKKFILEFQMDDPHDEQEFKDILRLLARSDSKKELKKIIHYQHAYDAINTILDYLVNHQDIHFEIHKILIESKLDVSLL